MWAIAIPTHSTVYFFVSYSPVLRPRINRNASLIRKRIANMNVNTKNLCIRNINIPIAKLFYTLSIYKNYARKAKKPLGKIFIVKIS